MACAPRGKLRVSAEGSWGSEVAPNPAQSLAHRRYAPLREQRRTGNKRLHVSGKWGLREAEQRAQAYRKQATRTLLTKDCHKEGSGLTFFLCSRSQLEEKGENGSQLASGRIVRPENLSERKSSWSQEKFLGHQNAGGFKVFILQMRKLRPKETKELGHSHSSN